MKKSKLTLVIALGLVLCLLCGTVTTFSWFSRPRTQSGDTLNWSGKYKISNGQNISYKTYESTDDGATFGTTELTELGGTVDAKKRRYFCTEIHNSGSTDQSVSLFLNNLKVTLGNSDNLYVGVNGPLKTYKQYNTAGETGKSSFTTAKNDTMRIYFNEANVWGGTRDINVCYYNAEGNVVYQAMTYIKDTVFFADIPATTDKLFFAVKLYKTDNQRTQEFTDIRKTDGLSQTNSLVIYLESNSKEGNYMKGMISKVSGANIVNYYSSIEISLNGSFTSSLKNGQDYIADGNGMHYYSGNDKIFTVDEHTGKITPKSKGTAKLYMKVNGGSYGSADGVSADCMQFECPVVITDNVTSNSYFPIVTNLEIRAATLDGAMVSKVYWYLKNESNSPISYTLDNLYISL